jgi:hypothetical protein
VVPLTKRAGRSLTPRRERRQGQCLDQLLEGGSCPRRGAEQQLAEAAAAIDDCRQVRHLGKDGGGHCNVATTDDGGLLTGPDLAGIDLRADDRT